MKGFNFEDHLTFRWNYKFNPYLWKDRFLRNIFLSIWAIISYLINCLSHLKINRKASFYKCPSETLKFQPLTLNQITNGFLHRTFWFFSLKNFGSPNTTNLLYTFPIFGHPTFWCWYQSACELLRVLKISIGRFSSTLSLFLEMKNTSYALIRG